MTEESQRGGVSRRGALGLLGAGAVGFAGASALRAGPLGAESHSEDLKYPFYGDAQSGIVTPVQQHLYFAALDMTSQATRDDLVALFKDWTEAAARLTQGLEVSPDGAVGGGALKPPDDTGEALGLAANGLTITFGLGPSLFTDASGADRFGLADRRPEALATLPAFAFDLIEDPISGGDLCIQACADDPQVAVHAIRNLTRIAFGRAQIRWAQLGYGRTSSTSREQVTPRNLFGFKDGTANLTSSDDSTVRASLWVPAADGPEWLAGGSYLITRKIAMLIESWDRVRLEEQESIFGRSKGEGAPLSGGAERTEPDFAVVSTAGGPVIPETAHVRLAHPDHNRGARLLRRGYNYVDGNNQLGQISAGLFFISYQRDPQQFIDVQRSLAKDALNEYIRHIGSGIFAVPPGIRRGGFVAEALFA